MSFSMPTRNIYWVRSQGASPTPMATVEGRHNQNRQED